MDTITNETGIEELISNWLDNIPNLSESDFLKLEDKIYSALENEDFENFLLQFDNITKLDAFLLIKDMISDKIQKIELFKQTWMLAEIQYVKVEEFKKLFVEYRNDIMNEEERTFYDSLPETITIYRGTRVPPEIDSGISWTTNKEIAEKFLNYPKGILDERQISGQNKPLYPNLRTKTINKKDIICCLKDRGEDEIIYW